MAGSRHSNGDHRVSAYDWENEKRSTNDFYDDGTMSFFWWVKQFNILRNICFLAHMCECTVGSYALLCVCLSVCDRTEIHWTIIHISKTIAIRVVKLRQNMPVDDPNDDLEGQGHRPKVKQGSFYAANWLILANFDPNFVIPETSVNQVRKDLACMLGCSGRLFMTACPTPIYLAPVHFSRIFARPEWSLSRSPGKKTWFSGPIWLPYM